MNTLLKKTKIDLPVQNFIEEYELNEKEEILFLALLKEGYTSSNENAREQNYLLNLISADEIERIKNRTLLDDNSKLISEGIFEYDELIGAFGGYSKIYFLNEEILNELVHPRKHKIEHLIKDTIFDLSEPKKGLDEVVLPQKTKEMLHIGDNSQTDILGALNSNWNAVIFGNKECSYNIDRIKSFVFFEQKF